MKAIDITIADDHIPKKYQPLRKANITVFDDSEKQCISFFPEEGMQHTDHIFDPYDPKEVFEAAEVLARFFGDSTANAMRFLKLLSH